MNVTRTILSSLFVLALSAGAHAEKPSIPEWALQRVREGLLKPLAEKARNQPRFSRASPPPIERRARVLASTFSTDARGRRFVPFAIDVRREDIWVQDDVRGCVYEGSGQLLVRIGDEHLPAEFLLGKRVEAVPGACVASEPRS